MTRRPRLPGAIAATILAVSFVVLANGCTGGTHRSAEHAPFAATTLQPVAGGPTTNLSAFQGRPVIVNFWAPWCTPCIKEMPAFDAVATSVGERLVIIGVTDSLDHAGTVRLAKSTGVTYPLFVDESGTFQSDLGVVNLPTTVFLDERGKVVRRHAGAFTEPELRRTIEALYGTR